MNFKPRSVCGAGEILAILSSVVVAQNSGRSGWHRGFFDTKVDGSGDVSRADDDHQGRHPDRGEARVGAARRLIASTIWFVQVFSTTPRSFAWSRDSWPSSESAGVPM